MTTSTDTTNPFANSDPVGGLCLDWKETLQLARKRARSFGRFDPARYIEMMEAIKQPMTAGVNASSGRQGLYTYIGDKDKTDPVQSLALDYWIRNSKKHTRRVIDCLIKQDKFWVYNMPEGEQEMAT